MQQRNRLPRLPLLRSSGAWALVLAFLLAQLLLPATAFAQEGDATPLPLPLLETAVEAGTSEQDAPLQEFAPQSTTVKLTANRDTFIASNQPNTNFGGLDNLDTGWYGAFGAVRPLIRFSLGSIPSNSKVYSAQLVMYLDFSLPANDGNMTLNGAPITQDWSENGATWNNAASIGGGQFQLGTVSAQPGWASFDLTSQVQSWVNGQGNNGLMIIGNESPSPSRARIFRSRHVGGSEPYLLVNYECDNLAPVSQMGSLPANSPSRFTVTWSGQDRAPSGCSPTGIRKFKVQYRVNNGSWADWKSTTSTSATFDQSVPNGARVDFRVHAEDNAGNVEPIPSNPQVSTVVISQAPLVIFTPLPAITNQASFTVQWSAANAPVGVASYDLQYQINGGAWADLLVQTQQTSYMFTNAQSGVTYGFRARARDPLGNVGAYPSAAQTQTTVELYPNAHMVPFNPNIINSTSPVTTAITLNWTATTPPGTTITQYQIYYRMRDLAGTQLQPWTLWQVFDASVTSASFPIQLGNGLYDFEATATNNIGQSTPFVGVAEATMIVDLNDTIKPAAYMPEVGRHN